MKKNLFGIILCTAATLALITACSSDSKTEDNKSATETTIATENGTTETGSYGYVNEGKGDNYAVDIFTEAAPENDETDDDVENNKDDHKNNEQQGSNNGEISTSGKTSSNNNVTTKNTENNSDNKSETTTDDGWSALY